MVEQSLVSVAASGPGNQNATSLLFRNFLFTYNSFTLVATFILFSVVYYQLLCKHVSHACECDYYSLLCAALCLDKLEDIKEQTYEPVQPAQCQWFFFFFFCYYISSLLVPAIFLSAKVLGLVWNMSETVKREKDYYVREVSPLIISSICYYMHCSNLLQGWLQPSWINI